MENNIKPKASTRPKNDLLDFFKEKEAKWRVVLPSQAIYAIRLDGKAFHTFTKQFDAPYDFKFMNAMDATAEYLVQKFTMGGMFAYVQSDEITIFFTDLMTSKLYDGKGDNKWKVEKLLSTYASAATGAFLKKLPDVEGIPVFDARVMRMDSFADIRSYMDWRRLDARKNSISMAAEQIRSPKQLMNISTKYRAALLVGTEYEVLPPGFFEGRLVSYTNEIVTTEFFNKKTQKDERVAKMGKVWSTTPATRERTAEVVDNLNEMFNDFQMNKAEIITSSPTA